MSLIEKYELAVKQNDIQDDPSQRRIVQDLDVISAKLNQPATWYARIYTPKVKGLYIMGPVGAGKTYLMDLFFGNLKEPRKARFHFHHFMQQVDKKLRQLQGHANPILEVVKQLSVKVRVLCLDEFLVNDVAYAMILAQLLKEMFKRKMVLVVTTNTEVDSLYKDGVGRERFLPAIEQIKKNCKIVSIHTDHDYRVGRGEEIKTYIYPLIRSTRKALDQQFHKITQVSDEDGEIYILNRPIKFIKAAKTTIWFDFKDLCDVPRCQLDYLEIANKFDTVFISDIPVLSKHSTIQTLLFMHFIDVAYDRGLRLFLSAAVAPAELYTEGELVVPFARTVSRLQEIQSMDYLRRHKYLQQNMEIE